MKFLNLNIKALLHSPVTYVVCGVVSVCSVLYSGWTTYEIVDGMTPGARHYIRSEPIAPDGLEIDIPTQMQAEQEILVDGDVSTFATEQILPLPEHSPEWDGSTDEIETGTALPEGSQKPPQEQSSTKPPASTQKPQTSQTEKPAQTQKPAQTEKPAQTQKPAQTEKPVQTQKPAQTEKPVQTQKPAQTEKPQSKPVTGWSVTYAQAKQMVGPDSAYDYEDLYWLSRIISSEARGESFTGQIGVGTVVLNRMRSKEFPATVKGVVFDRKYGTQFTPVANGSIYNAPTQSAIVAAKMCLDGYTLSDSVLYFLNPTIATSSWIQNNRKYAFRVGNHEFYY